jgi:hypothetical protein
MLKALQGVLRRSEQQNLPLREIKQQAEAISPSFGGLFDLAAWSPDVKSALILLLSAIITALITLRQDPVTVNVHTIDPAALIDAISRIPTGHVLRGDADQRIAEAVRTKPLGPPKLKPDDASRPVQDPKKDKPP